jgi:hypothetical protein
MVGRSYDPDTLKPYLERIANGEDIVAIRNETGIATGTLLKYFRKLAYSRKLTPHLPAPSAPISQGASAPPHPRILFYDLETNPNQGWFFSLYSDKRAIPLPFVEKSKSITTIGYKWLGEPDAHVISIADFPFSDAYDDKWVIKTFLPIYEQANYTVAHFGSGFDEPFLAARCMVNGLPPLPPVCNIDTYRMAKTRFRDTLNSNKLDHLGTLLELGNKNKTDATLWVRCAKGDREALKIMAEYCAQDVRLLEQVFVKMLPYVKSKINLNLLVDDPVLHCKPCGSTNIELKGFELTAATLRHRYQCQDCLAWSTHKPIK